MYINLEFSSSNKTTSFTSPNENEHNLCFQARFSLDLPQVSLERVLIGSIFSSDHIKTLSSETWGKSSFSQDEKEYIKK